MKVVKNSVRRTLLVISNEKVDFSKEVMGVHPIRVKHFAIGERSQKVTKTVRLKGDCKKRRFRDIEEAHEVLHRIERYRQFSSTEDQAVQHRRENRAYRCPTCRGAHLTSKPDLTEQVMHVA